MLWFGLQIRTCEVKTPESKLFGQKADVITRSKPEEEALEIVRRRIPNAFKKKFTDQHIADESLKQVKTLSKELEPELQKVPLSQGLMKKLKTQAEAAKEQLKDTTEFTILDSGAKERVLGRLDRLLVRTETTTGKKTLSQNLDDLWKSATAYDKSFSDAVKGPSTRGLSQSQLIDRAIWKSGRKILRDALTDAETQLGRDTAAAFKDMRGLYLVRDTIIRNAGTSTKPKAGLIKTLAKWGGITALGSAGLSGILGD